VLFDLVPTFAAASAAAKANAPTAIRAPAESFFNDISSPL
jgi:hypothetical protein